MRTQLTICSLVPDYHGVAMTGLPIELARHYREEADRVRKLAAAAALPGVREALLNVVREYDQLADSVGGASDHWARG